MKWAFGFPGDQSAYAQPAVAGGRVFVGSPAGVVYALSAATGCVHWFFDAERPVRTAVMISRVRTNSGQRDAAFFGDQGGTAYALDAATGALLWKTKVEDFPGSRVTGSPVFHNGRLYVPVASGEETAGAAPDYQCCRSRGSLVALDAATGKQIWKTYMIPEEPIPTKKSSAGTQLWGPSGASIWNSPTIDVRRNTLYVGTGNNFSDPPTRTSDAIVAMDLASGKIRWSRQMTAADAWTVGCRLPDKTNCAEANGPDFDFSSSPILVTMANGRRVLVAGQKSGMVHGLDPDADGKVLWSVKVGEGGTMGGVQWGSAADRSNAYVALSDIGRITLPNTLATDADPKRGGGMFALRVDTGERVWYTPPPGCGDRPRCSPAQSAAVSAIPGVVFSGSVDGHLRAYATANGAIVWDFDTVAPYQTVNGVAARGGSLNGPGPAIAGGMLFTNSGYVNAGGMPGNVLLAFSVDGKYESQLQSRSRRCANIETIDSTTAYDIQLIATVWKPSSAHGVGFSPGISRRSRLRLRANVRCGVPGATPTATSISAAASRCVRSATTPARSSLPVSSRSSIGTGRCTSRLSAASRWSATAS